MAQNYAGGPPTGNNGVPLYQSPAPFKALKQYYSGNGGTSSVITLTDNTTAIEIGAQGAAVLMRWVSIADGTGANSSVISTNYDHVIPAGTVRRFALPIEQQNNAQGYSSVVGQRVAYGLYARVAYKNEGTGSVFASEYGTSNSY